jgi:hypothetical protein
MQRVGGRNIVAISNSGSPVGRREVHIKCRRTAASCDREGRHLCAAVALADRHVIDRDRRASLSHAGVHYRDVVQAPLGGVLSIVKFQMRHATSGDDIELIFRVPLRGLVDEPHHLRPAPRKGEVVRRRAHVR